MQRSQHICNLGIFGGDFCDKNQFFKNETNHVSLYSNTYAIHLHFFTKKEKRVDRKILVTNINSFNTHSIYYCLN